MKLIEHSTYTNHIGPFVDKQVIKEITDNYPKYVITFYDPMMSENHDGILQKNLIDFLMMEI